MTAGRGTAATLHFERLFSHFIMKAYQQMRVMSVTDKVLVQNILLVGIVQMLCSRINLYRPPLLSLAFFSAFFTSKPLFHAPIN